tara:strand:- start:459 stop:650 length:192 start_codon:yes stop_codon:yes gene_type:complete
MSNIKNTLEKDIELLTKLNVRALKLVKIEEHFMSKKIHIDTAYLDTLSDEKIDEIYKNHCNGK